ncbi:MAG: hypothetical protein AMR96_02440 [Candidatus Adiutrix intracellularis]|jgi:hypothetical protein|nr:MAG: hypothetical protein AMR96_02440 [Candidatus Adiutrix intracellularis]MDR2826968.1 hypothetical protein [Candidatus Adiutrix intracellularis]
MVNVTGCKVSTASNFLIYLIELYNNLSPDSFISPTGKNCRIKVITLNPQVRLITNQKNFPTLFRHTQ